MLPVVVAATVLLSKALPLASTSEPPLIVVGPENVLELLSVSEPLPALVRLPEPLITPA